MKSGPGQAAAFLISSFPYNKAPVKVCGPNKPRVLSNFTPHDHKETERTSTIPAGGSWGYQTTFELPQHNVGAIRNTRYRFL